MSTDEPKEWEDDNVDVYEMQTESEIQTDNQYMDGEADTSLR